MGVARVIGTLSPGLGLVHRRVQHGVEHVGGIDGCCTVVTVDGDDGRSETVALDDGILAGRRRLTPGHSLNTHGQIQFDTICFNITNYRHNCTHHSEVLGT